MIIVVAGTLIQNVCFCFQEAEMASIKMQETLDNLREEKERLLNSLVEAEYVISHEYNVEK